MQILKNGWGKLTFVIVTGLMLITANTGHAQTQTTVLPGLGAGGADSANSTQITQPVVPTPGITVAVTNTNQVVITITNGASYANYELYRRTMLDAGHPWTISVTGAQGQTNFLADMGLSLSFFQVAVGSDWDRDGIPNSSDGDPCDPLVGTLSITIDNPTQNGLFQ